MDLSKSLPSLQSRAYNELDIKDEYNKYVRQKVYGNFPFEQIQEFEVWINNERPPYKLIAQRLDVWIEYFS